MKSTKSPLTFFLAFALIAFCVSVVYSQESSEKARQILDKTVEKYGDLLKKDSKDLKSIAAKVSVKGGGQLPMGGAGDMPVSLDMAVTIYAARPKRLYLDISGNLGEARIIVAGEEKLTTTIILPGTKQFAAIEVPEQIIQDMEKDDPQEPHRLEEFWGKVVLLYEGTQDLKAGKAHKIIVKPKDPSEKGVATVHILDGKWDPARFEINNPEEGGGIIVEFEKLELNVDIPDERFVPDTAGYTQVTEQQLMGVIMMQVMAATMQREE